MSTERESALVRFDYRTTPDLEHPHRANCLIHHPFLRPTTVVDTPSNSTRVVTFRLHVSAMHWTSWG
jgi:hypothetical protein